MGHSAIPSLICGVELGEKLNPVSEAFTSYSHPKFMLGLEWGVGRGMQGAQCCCLPGSCPIWALCLHNLISFYHSFVRNALPSTQPEDETEAPRRHVLLSWTRRSRTGGRGWIRAAPCIRHGMGLMEQTGGSQAHGPGMASPACSLFRSGGGNAHAGSGG